MKLHLDFDASRLLSVLGDPKTDRTKRKMGYALANAVNETALQLQVMAVEALDDTFTLRGGQQEAFLRRNVAVVRARANPKQNRFHADLGVGIQDRLLLSSFERGDTRRPFTPGAKHVAVPVTGGARPNFASRVSPDLLYRRLGLKQVVSQRSKKALRAARPALQIASGLAGLTGKQRTALAKQAKATTSRVWAGKHRTFMIPGKGVFQRVGVGKDSIRTLYVFAQNPRLPATLGFVRRAQASGGLILRHQLEESVLRELFNEGQSAPRR